jgi:LmbE family N-acetylglucosaminyl deacetylase
LAAAMLVVAGGDFASAPIAELDAPLGRDTRLLVVAPHPDDEALGAAGLIQRVRQCGGEVQVLLLTSGDGFPEGVETADHIRRPSANDYRNYGTVREYETIAAMESLGVDRAHITFLGFPDGGLCLIASRYLSNKIRAFHSPYTGRTGPPAADQIIRGVTYRATDLLREIEAVLTSYRPTLIVLPHPEDRHPDHCATAIFVSEALDALAGRGGVVPATMTYLIHYEDWPDLDESPVVPLAPPSRFPPAEGEWRTLTLTRQEAAVKQRAITAYSTQMLVLGRLLRSFARPNELFIQGDGISAPECWCDTTNVATESSPEAYRHRSRERR